MPILFAIVGATGTGKSGVAVELAARYGADIIGVDSRQVYKGFAIGTAQPSAADMEKVKREEQHAHRHRPERTKEAVRQPAQRRKADATPLLGTAVRGRPRFTDRCGKRKGHAGSRCV